MISDIVYITTTFAKITSPMTLLVVICRPLCELTYEQFRVASGLSTDCDDKQVSTLLYCLGEEAESVLVSTSATEADRKDHVSIMAKFDAFFNVRRNVIFERARFNSSCWLTPRGWTCRHRTLHPRRSVHCMLYTMTVFLSGMLSLLTKDTKHQTEYIHVFMRDEKEGRHGQTNNKYLGVIISSDLSWSHHIQALCSKTRKLLGLLYRRFSSYSNAEVMLKLYLTIVRPHLDYAAQVWHPYQAKNITALENVQKFALRICSRSYDTNYQDLLDCYHLPSLENRRIYLSLCTFYKIVNSIIFFPSHYLPVASPLSSLPLSLRCNHSNHFKLPYARTNSFKFSFLPSMLL